LHIGLLCQPISVTRDNLHVKRSSVLDLTAPEQFGDACFPIGYHRLSYFKLAGIAEDPKPTFDVGTQHTDIDHFMHDFITFQRPDLFIR